MLIPGINYMVFGYIKEVLVVTLIMIGIFKTGNFPRMLCYNNAFGNKYFGKQSLSATRQYGSLNF